MDIAINPEVVEIIDRYMDSGKPKTSGLERICIIKMQEMANVVILRNSAKTFIRLKGDNTTQEIYEDKYKRYFQGGSWYQYSWWGDRRKWGSAYFLHSKCELYFEENSKKFVMNFLNDTYGTIENAVSKTENFMILAEEFE